MTEMALNEFSAPSGVALEPGQYGLRAVLSAWSDEIQKFLLAQAVVELELNDGKVWRSPDISFLADLPDLEVFEITHLKIQSIDPIHYLHRLRSLKAMTYCKTEIRFQEFPDLEECRLQWRPKAVSIFDRTNLRKLFINRYDGKNLIPFASLLNLESLALLGAPLQSLHGLDRLEKLRALRLGDLRSLESLSGIERLINLERLEINTCRAISIIEQIGRLPNLKYLHLTNCGDIETLSPLRDLNKLKAVTFSESTNIVDGDLTPLVGHKLAAVSFRNRRHYSHKREQFDGYRNFSLTSVSVVNQ